MKYKVSYVSLYVLKVCCFPLLLVPFKCIGSPNLTSMKSFLKWGIGV